MYQSNALWREGVCHSKYGDNITTDTHDTEEQAVAVCYLLEKSGYGGERKEFPIKTWVSPPQDPPVIPKDDE